MDRNFPDFESNIDDINNHFYSKYRVHNFPYIIQLKIAIVKKLNY